MSHYGADCWCGMDHSRMDMDQDGNWYELPDEDSEEEVDAKPSDEVE